MTVVLQLTGKCHMNCHYCLDTYKNVVNKSTSEVKKAIDKLVILGYKTFVVTGGEVTLRHDLNELLKYIASFDIKIILHTEGSFINYLTPEVLNLIHTISLPLDSYLSSENTLLNRYSNQVNICFDAIKYIENNSNCHIRISSVLTKLNTKGIVELAKHINYEWRVYAFIPVGNGLINQDNLLLSNEEFLNTCNKINNKHLKIMHIDGDYENYHFVNPNMQLLKNDIIINDLLNDKRI